MSGRKNITIVLSEESKRVIQHLPKGKRGLVFNQVLLGALETGLMQQILVSMGEISCVKDIKKEYEYIKQYREGLGVGDLNLSSDNNNVDTNTKTKSGSPHINKALSDEPLLIKF